MPCTVILLTATCTLACWFSGRFTRCTTLVRTSCHSPTWVTQQPQLGAQTLRHHVCVTCFALQNVHSLCEWPHSPEEVSVGFLLFMKWVVSTTVNLLTRILGAAIFWVFAAALLIAKNWSGVGIEPTTSEFISGALPTVWPLYVDRLRLVNSFSQAILGLSPKNFRHSTQNVLPRRVTKIFFRKLPLGRSHLVYQQAMLGFVVCFPKQFTCYSRLDAMAFWRSEIVKKKAIAKKKARKNLSRSARSCKFYLTKFWREKYFGDVR